MDDWESYWRNIRNSGQTGLVFWDSVPERAALEDLQRFKGHMQLDLPLLDLGCGNGRQSRLLAAHFTKVIGADISASAIALAMAEAAGTNNVEYRVLDAINTEDARKLHDEFGDMNIYVRGVLHMIKMHDRPKFVNSLAVLLGEHGVLYQIELPMRAFLYWRTLPKDMWSLVPKITRRVGFNLEDRSRFFPDDKWQVLDQGDDVTIRTIPLSDGKVAEVPANYLVLRTKKADHVDSGYGLSDTAAASV